MILIEDLSILLAAKKGSREASKDTLLGVQGGGRSTLGPSRGLGGGEKSTGTKKALGGEDVQALAMG